MQDKSQLFRSSLLILLILLGLTNSLFAQNSSWVPALYKGIPPADKTSLFEDEFEDNRNNWELTHRSSKLTIVEGDLFCKTRSSETFLAQNIKLQKEEGFEIEARIRFANGDPKSPVGIAFGKNGLTNMFRFEISTEKKFRIIKQVGRQITEIHAWQESELIRRYSYNLLTVRKVDDSWFFFINKKRLFQVPAATLMGSELGVVIGKNLQIEVDYFSVTRIKDVDRLGPVIILSKPKLLMDDHITVEKATQDISGQVVDASGVKELRINRVLVTPSASGKFSASIRLKGGTTRIVLEAVDEADNRTTRVIYMDYSPTQEFTGKNYLLTIGIDRYSHWGNLSNATKDCHDVAQVLIQHYGFTENNTYRIFNEAASRENILEVFEELQRVVKPEDNLLIYYAGHGYYDNRSERGYWVPAGARKNKFPDYIRNSTIHDYLNGINSHNTLIMADACYAGSLFSQGRGEIDEDNPSRWAFTSGNIQKVWDGQPGDNSPFAKYLIRFLENNNKPKLRADEIINYVSEVVKRNTNQEPLGNPLRNVGDEGGVFVFYRK